MILNISLRHRLKIYIWKGKGMERVDIAIIGTGPAGVSAAITSKVRNKNILLFGTRNLSDKIIKANKILNYPGLSEISGKNFSLKLKEHLEYMNITVTEKKIITIYPMGDFFGLQTAEDMYEAKSVIIAAGVVHGQFLPGERELLGKGVSYCATCDAGLYKGKTVAVIGYNEEAEKETEFLAQVVGKVYYFPIKNKEVKFDKEVEIIEEIPREIIGNEKAEMIKTDKGEYKIDGVFILRDAVPPEQLVSGIELIDNHIKVNLMMETNIKGLFACGDIVGKPYQYIKAAGQGNVAALSAVSYLS